MQSLSKLLFITLFTSACASNDFTKTVPYVDRDRYMGTWYVQAGRFTFLEQQVHNAIEKYSWNQEEERIEVDFTYNKGSINGPLKSLPQLGWIENHETNATWKISPLRPFKFTYLIIALDKNYEWVAIGVPSQKYLWLMTREKQFDKLRLQSIIKEVEATGYNVKDIEYVPQS